MREPFHAKLYQKHTTKVQHAADVAQSDHFMVKTGDLRRITGGGMPCANKVVNQCKILERSLVGDKFDLMEFFCNYKCEMQNLEALLTSAVSGQFLAYCWP